MIRPQVPYSGACQDNAIVWRGNRYGYEHYSLIIYDNYIDDDCNAAYPTQEVFAGGAAGYDDFQTLYSAPNQHTEWGGYPTANANPHVKWSGQQWYCVMEQYDGATGTIRMYVDDVLTFVGSPSMLRVDESNLATSHSWHNQYNYTGNNNLYIGCSNTPTWFPYWLDADIDDIQIYDGIFNGNGGVQTYDWFANACHDIHLDGTPGKPGTTSVASEIKTDEVNITPNPSQGIFKINTLELSGNGKISLTNSVGSNVGQYKLDKSGTTSLDLSDLPAGFYFADIELKGEHVIKKIIKE